MIPHSPTSQRLAELPTHQRIAALGQVPLSPCREAAFATILGEFELLYQQLLKESKVWGEERAGRVKAGGEPGVMGRTVRCASTDAVKRSSFATSRVLLLR